MIYKDYNNMRKILSDKLKTYTGSAKILLPFESDLLFKLFFEDGKFCKELAPYVEIIDFSNIPFDGFEAREYDFSKLSGVTINPSKLKDHDLSLATCKGVKFEGSFAGVCLYCTDFNGSKGAKIDPQTISLKSLRNTKCNGVTFISDESFDTEASFKDVDIRGTDFSGSKGAFINPQVIYDRDLTKTICKDVVFIKEANAQNEDVNFDSVILNKTDFTGSKGAVINPQRVYERKIQNTKCKDVTFSESLDGCNISGTDFSGSKGAVINFNNVRSSYVKEFLSVNFKDVKFIGTIEDGQFLNASFRGSTGAKISLAKFSPSCFIGTDCCDVEFDTVDFAFLPDTKLKGSNYDKLYTAREKFKQKVKSLF